MHTTCNILPSPRTDSNFVPDHYQALSDLINLTNKYGKDDDKTTIMQNNFIDEKTF